MTDVHFEPPVFIAGAHDPRLEASFRRLMRSDYEPASVIVESRESDWPGDLAGRLLLSLSRYARAGFDALERARELCEEILNEIDEIGHFGAPLGAVVDEQQLACHGWVVAGLLQYATVSGDQRAARAARRVTETLTLPALRRLDSYPRERPLGLQTGEASGTAVTELNGWLLSTDVWCVLLTLNGLVPFTLSTGDDAARSAILRLADVFADLDLVAQRAQLHASLAAARCLSDYAIATADDSLLLLTARVYDTYVENARTLNYATFNWFGRPDSWTEPCAIVDSLGIAQNLADATGDPRYIVDALRIADSGLSFAERPDGSFGLDSVATPAAPTLSRIHPDARWCCTVRGAIGLLEARERSVSVDGDVVTVRGTHSGNVRVDGPTGDRSITLACSPEGDTLHASSAGSSGSDRPVTIRWTDGLTRVQATVGLDRAEADLTLDRAENVVETSVGTHVRFSGSTLLVRADLASEPVTIDHAARASGDVAVLTAW